MRRRLLVLLAVLALGLLVAAMPASAASHDVRAKKVCVLKKKAKCKKANLSKQKIAKQNLVGAKLVGANLSGSTLTGTNLAGADLTGANLRGATLKGVNLTGAKLTGATFAGASISRVDFSSPKASKRATRSALNVFRCAVSLNSLKASGIVADCKGASLRGVSFAGATIVNSDFRGADLAGANFTSASVASTDFSGAVMTLANLDKSTVSSSTFAVTLLERGSAVGATISQSDFTDAFVVAFEPMVALTKSGNGNRLTRTLGLRGTTMVTFDSARGTRAHATVEARSNNTVWDLPAVSCSLLCFFDGVVDDTFTATISTAAGAKLTVSSGITCSGSFVCTGTFTGNFMSVNVTPPTMYTVTVNSVLQNSGGATPMSKIRFETVTNGVSRRTIETCVAKTTCSISVASETVVRVSVFREHSNGYFGMNCPGETGDAFTNNRTLWPNGDDTFSGDAGDTTRYALHRYCDAFTVTGDVTLTAINDTPDGAPSG